LKENREQGAAFWALLPKHRRLVAQNQEADALSPWTHSDSDKSSSTGSEYDEQKEINKNVKLLEKYTYNKLEDTDYKLFKGFIGQVKNRNFAVNKTYAKTNLRREYEKENAHHYGKKSMTNATMMAND